MLLLLPAAVVPAVRCPTLNLLEPRTDAAEAPAAVAQPPFLVVVAYLPTLSLARLRPLPWARCRPLMFSRRLDPSSKLRPLGVASHRERPGPLLH